MMTNRDVSELRRRLKFDKQPFESITSFYIDNDKSFLYSNHSSFWSIDDDVQKMLISATKSMFPRDAVSDRILTLRSQSDKTQTLNILTTINEAPNTEADEMLVDRILEYFGYSGRLAIFIIHDIYDVPTMATDGAEMDSDLSYRHFYVLICPVKLTKPALTFTDSGLEMASQTWSIEKPTLGFVYPAFDDRGPDNEEIMYYTARADQPHHELIQALEFQDTFTATEYRQFFQKKVVTEVLKDDESIAKLNGRLAEIGINDPDSLLTGLTLQGEAIKAGIEADTAEELCNRFMDKLKNPDIKVSWVVDKRSASYAEVVKKMETMRNLIREGATLAENNGSKDLAEEMREFVARSR